MQNEEVTRDSKQLSWLLRHGAIESGVAMDAAGWVAIDDALKALRLTRERLMRAVEDNTKSRLQLDGPRIRACQGHSLAGTPVTLEGLEASWTVHTSDEVIWHGTSVEAVASIAREGILAVARTHVHLAEALDSRVGKRANVHVMLGVSPARLRARGLGVFQSPNGVLLVRRVPPDCIASLEPGTARARARDGELRALFGLTG